MATFRFRSLRDDTVLEEEKLNEEEKAEITSPRDKIREHVDKLALVVNNFENETWQDIASNAEIVTSSTELLSLAQKGVASSHFGDTAALHGLPLILWKIAEKIAVKNLFSDKTPPPVQVVKVVHAITWLIGNATHASKFFARQVELEAGGILNWMLAIASSKRIRENLEDPKLCKLADGCLASFLNISKLPETRRTFVKLGAIDALSFYLTASVDDLKCMVMIFTAHIVGDSDSGRLADNFGVIESITAFLQTAMKSPQRNFSGFSVEELTEGVSLLLINDSNKSKFVSVGILPLLEELLDSEDRLEQSRAIDCIWALAFDKKERQKIMKQTKIAKKLENLAKSCEDQDLKLKAANSLTYIIRNFITKAKAVLAISMKAPDENGQQERRESQVSPNESNSSGYLFISYSHKQQKDALRIRDALKSAGYDVWIDVEKMQGSTLQAEAEAIEKSTGAIICFSEDYSKSNSCRAEAEYIYQQQKPFVPVRMVYGFKADGWLGILLGVQFYVDIASEKATFQQACSKLMEQINAKVPVFGEKPNLDVSERKEDHEDHSIAVKQPQAIVSWTKEDVRKWLNRENLQKVARIFEALDGRMLGTLREMKLKAPESYYTMVSRQLGDNMTETLLLLEALDRLWLPSSKNA